MVDEFYVILSNAMKLEDGSNFVLNEEDFYKDSIMVRDFLKSIYDGYPDINKEQVKKMMENIINEMLEESAKCPAFRSDTLKRNTMETLLKDEKLMNETYNEIIKEEKESGKRLKCKDSIRYSANPQTARTQLLEDAIASSRSYLSKFDKDLINQTKSISKSELIRRILARTGKTKENRQGLQFDVDFIYSKNELERAKILIKRNMDEMDKTLKQGYIDALMIIGKNLNLYGVLNEYVQRQNEQSRRMGFDNVMQISSDSVFNTEKLEKMSLHKLAALYAFWTNRFVKVVLVMYKSYIIMYELGLDTKDKIDDDRNFREVSKGKIKALGIKFAFVYLQAKKMYDKMYEKAMKRADFKKSEVVYQDEEIAEIAKKFEKKYREYFSSVGGLECFENDLKKDITLYSRLENIREFSYKQKDNSIYSLMDFLITENVSKNWGIIDENKKSRYVLVGADIPGLNMPLRLHIDRSEFLKFIYSKQGSSIIRLYDGKEDFMSNGKNIGTNYLFPITYEQEKSIIKTADNTRETDYRSGFINHLAFLADPRRYPKHLQKMKKIIKKGKEKAVYEVVPRYIDLEDGKKYIKNENDELVLYSEER